MIREMDEQEFGDEYFLDFADLECGRHFNHDIVPVRLRGQVPYSGHRVGGVVGESRIQFLTDKAIHAITLSKQRV